MTSLLRLSCTSSPLPIHQPLPFYFHLRWPILLKSDSERKCGLSATSSSMLYYVCVCVFLSHPSLSYSICLPVFVCECIFFTMPSHYWIYYLFIYLIIILFCLKNVPPPLLFFTLLPVLRRHLVCHFLLVLTLCVLAYSAKKKKKIASAKLIFTFQCISSMSSRHRLITLGATHWPCTSGG